MAELHFKTIEQVKLAEEILGFPILGDYVKLQIMSEIRWLADRIKERLISRKLNPKNIMVVE